MKKKKVKWEGDGGGEGGGRLSEKVFVQFAFKSSRPKRHIIVKNPLSFHRRLYSDSVMKT